MLVISRKAGECLRIGDNIEIMVVKVQGRRVRLGISAPREIQVFRKEIAPPTQAARKV